MGSTVDPAPFRDRYVGGLLAAAKLVKSTAAPGSGDVWSTRTLISQGLPDAGSAVISMVVIGALVRSVVTALKLPISLMWSSVPEVHAGPA
jgi:hypothetical protein